MISLTFYFSTYWTNSLYIKTIIASIAARMSLYIANGMSFTFEISFKKKRIEMSANTNALTKPTT
jgi:hypothetical protein